MDSGWLDGISCYECEFEPKTVGSNEATRVIALRDDVLVSSAIAIGGVDSRVDKAATKACSSMLTRQHADDIYCFFVVMRRAQGQATPFAFIAETISTGLVLQKPMAKV